MRPLGAMLAAVLALAWGAQAAAQTDVHAMFDQAERDSRVGLARKTRPVDVRAAQPGEVVVTVVAGEGKETQSPPAKPGDMVEIVETRPMSRRKRWALKKVVRHAAQV